MYKIAICDDEKQYRKTIKDEILRIGINCGEICFWEFESGEELLESRDTDFNLLFLDIQMSGIDGNETSKRFREGHKNCILVFCTNYQNPTVDHFKVRPYRYIMKDLHNKMLVRELPDIMKKLAEETPESYVAVTQDGSIMRIPVRNILFLSVEDRRTKIVYEKDHKAEELHCREKLKDLYPVLKADGCEYAHSSYIVNMRKVIRVNKNVLTLCNEKELNISRSKAKQFNHSFSEFLCRKYKRS